MPLNVSVASFLTCNVKAAAALECFSIDSPLKKTVKIVDDERLPESPESLGDEEQTHDKIGELRKKFVGEIDLPESMFMIFFFLKFIIIIIITIL